MFLRYIYQEFKRDRLMQTPRIHTASLIKHVHAAVMVLSSLSWLLEGEGYDKTRAGGV